MSVQKLESTGELQLWQILLPARGIHVIVLVSFPSRSRPWRNQKTPSRSRRRPAATGRSRPGGRRGKKGARERRIVDLLNRGVSTAELAAAEGVTLRRMQILFKTILARHAPSAPADYLALQISRLNQVTFVACGEMGKGDLKVVDRVIRVVGETDRYHGFFPNADDKRVRPDRLASPTQAPLALAVPADVGFAQAASGAMEMAPQRLEKARFGDGNGAAAAGPNDDPPMGAMEMAPEAFEKA
jgi:hypothetical protein